MADSKKTKYIKKSHFSTFFYSKMAHFPPPELVRQVNKLEWPKGIIITRDLFLYEVSGCFDREVLNILQAKVKESKNHLQEEILF